MLFSIFNCLVLFFLLGVPLVVSLPHFLFANHSVINAVGGMQPRKEDHATFISIEPVRLLYLFENFLGTATSFCLLSLTFSKGDFPACNERRNFRYSRQNPYRIVQRHAHGIPFL